MCPPFHVIISAIVSALHVIVSAPSRDHSRQNSVTVPAPSRDHSRQNNVLISKWRKSGRG